jgi:hypothetical protein
VPGKFISLVRGDCQEFNIYALQVQDAFSPERAGNGIQARHFPVAGKSSFGILEPAAVCPVVNPLPEGVHSIPQLEEVAAREDPPAILEECCVLRLPMLLLPGSLLPLQPRGTTCLKPSSADGG